MDSPHSFSQTAHTSDYQQQHGGEVDEHTLTYRTFIARIRTNVQMAAQHQGVSAQEVLAAVDNWSPSGPVYDAGQVTGSHGQGLTTGREISDLSPPVPLQQTLNPYEQSFHDAAHSLGQVDRPGPSNNNPSIFITSHTGMYEPWNGQTWPMSHMSNASGSAYTTQTAQPAAVQPQYAHYSATSSGMPSEIYPSAPPPNTLHQTATNHYQMNDFDPQRARDDSAAVDTNSPVPRSSTLSPIDSSSSPIDSPSSPLDDTQTGNVRRKRCYRRKNCQQLPPKTRPKRYDDVNQQIQTNETRRKGACIRCRMQRTRCVLNPDDPNGPCLTCLAVMEPIVYKGPCRRDKIKHACLLDHEGRPRLTWTLRWSQMELEDIRDWASTEIRTISVTQDIGGLTIDLPVRRFIAQEGDHLERCWVVDGQERVYWCTPYAIENMQQAAMRYQAFVKGTTLIKFLNHYIRKPGADALIRDTYMMALKYARSTKRPEESRLLKNVFRLWMGSRMETRSDRICGAETLDMQPCPGPDRYNEGKILLPPVLTAQAEIIVTKVILQPAAKAVLKDLDTLVSANKAHSWFAIYLAMFILMHSCSLLIAADYKKAEKQGLGHQPYRRALIADLHLGAMNLLAHFHYISNSRSPFKSDGQLGQGHHLSRDNFDAAQLQFLQTTCHQVKERSALYENVRRVNDYQHEAYLFSQLYDEDWDPDHIV